MFNLHCILLIFKNIDNDVIKCHLKNILSPPSELVSKVSVYIKTIPYL